MLPSQGTVTATNSGSTGNPGTPAAAFPILAAYVVSFPPTAFPTTLSGRVLGGTFDNNILGFWENNLGCIYSDDIGGVGGATTAQNFFAGTCTGLNGGKVVANTPYAFTFYCNAARACQMWINGRMYHRQNPATAPNPPANSP